MKKSLPTISGVYFIINNLNNKIYIGSAIDVKKRLILHKSQLKNNVHHSISLQRAVDKYGIDNFSFYLFEVVKDVNDLIKTEQKWMDFFKPEYNILKKAGSRLGMKHSQETKALMSEQKKGHIHYGPFKLSDETKALMSEQRKGGLNGRAKKVNIDGIIYETITAASKALNIGRDTIISRINKLNNYNYE